MLKLYLTDAFLLKNAASTRNCTISFRNTFQYLKILIGFPNAWPHSSLLQCRACYCLSHLNRGEKSKNRFFSFGSCHSKPSKPITLSHLCFLLFCFFWLSIMRFLLVSCFSVSACSYCLSLSPSLHIILKCCIQDQTQYFSRSPLIIPKGVSQMSLLFIPPAFPAPTAHI